jgi:hypothetical protein
VPLNNPIQKLAGLVTDGVPSTVERMSGASLPITNDVKNTTNLDLIICNCFILTYPMVQDIIRKADCHSACQKHICFLMEPEGSLSCSQKLVTGPYPEPAGSSSPHRS